MALLTTRGACGALLVLSLLVGFPAAAGGQDPLLGPPSDPPALRIPPQAITKPPTTDEERGDDAGVNQEDVEGGAVEKIQEMLEGRGESEETGDPILDGVLDLLRSRGSVLEGSALDPRSEGPELRPMPGGGTVQEQGEWAPYREGQTLPRPLPRADSAEAAPRPGTAEDASRYLLAEQLLRTARLLAAQPHADAHRQRLIEDLRREAARCLTREPMPASELLTPPNLGPLPAGHSESF